MNHLESIGWAVDKLLGARKQPRDWYCENCDQKRPIAEMVVEEDPQIPGLHVYFCSTRCCSHWMERDAKYLSN